MKPREFIIDNTAEYCDSIQDLSEDFVWGKYHVIEKSAYDKAIEALKKVSKGLGRSGIPHSEAKFAKQTLKDLGELDD